MSYSKFTLATVKKTFGITTSEDVDILASVSKQKCSEHLAETLRYNVPLALSSNSEKARSEMIIAPILIEVKKQLHSQLSLFSGVEFDVDAEKGLTGYCDFILSHSSEQLIVTAPVMMLVEGKNENLKGGLGQCIAEMVAAQLFNAGENNKVSSVYGAITTGTNWKFLKLTGNVVEINLNEYYLTDIEKILKFLTDLPKITMLES